MSSLDPNSFAKRVWFEDDSLWVELKNGQTLITPLSFFPRLMAATEEQRAKFFISGDGQGIHWRELDEDISVEGLLKGQGDMTVRRTSC
jgi:Protein of unknown function (DUF2442)